MQQMQEDGMVVSERETPDDEPSRWRYSISERGREYLESWAGSLARYQEDIDLFLKVYSGASAREGEQTESEPGRMLMGDFASPL